MKQNRQTYIRRGLLLAVLLAAAAAAGSLWNAAQTAGCRQADLAQITDLSFLPDAQQAAAGETVKRVCLTFDDGPSENTRQVLAVLAKEQVPATFFVISAENNSKDLPLVQQEVAEGHQVALHSASHEYKEIYASTDAYWADIEKLKEALRPYIDVDSIDCLRFPGGSTNTVSRKYGGKGIMQELKAQAEAKGYHWVDWNVCADDAVGGKPSASQIARNVIQGAEDQDQCVVLMHDSSTTRTTAEALPEIITWFREEGYAFCTVDQVVPLPSKEEAASISG